MGKVTVTRTISAPTDAVFRTISDIGNFSQVVPDIVNVEILSEVKSGVGARFRETRKVNGRGASTELEVTEFVPNERIRLISDGNGTHWDSLFTVRPEGGKTLLTLTMDAEPRTIVSRLMSPLIGGLVRKALEKDMDAVKAHCERS